MFICEISIIIISICQKLRSVGPVQQKIKLPSPNRPFTLKLKRKLKGKWTKNEKKVVKWANSIFFE